jgi:putative oxidoreductase
LLLARVLLAQLFILAALGKIQAVADTQRYMVDAGVSALLFWPVVALELGGALAVILGWFTAPASLALGAFSIAAALLFHKPAAGMPPMEAQMQMIMLLKDFCIAGGFLILAVHGPGDWSVDNWSSRPGNTD